MPSGKGVIIYKADLEYVRQLLASTERLLKDVAAAIEDAQRLQEEARTLHSTSTWPHPLKPSQATAPPPGPGWSGRPR